MDFDARHRLYRRWLKAPVFARLYGRVIGPASAHMFGEVLQTALLDRLPPAARVLEIGCGPGLQAVELLRRRPDLRLTASDFSAGFVEVARRNARHEATPPDFVVADAMDLSAFETGTFDAVYSLTAIKHFPDPVRGLREALRVLRPGGALIVAEICRESDLAEVENLTRMFAVPGWVRPLLTRLVHGSLRDDCPAFNDVQRWLREVGGEGPTRLPGYPVWIATLTAGA